MFDRVPINGLLLTILAFLSTIAVLFAKQILSDPRKKTRGDKVLLKELLEGFGLEIPSELKDSESSAIKSIKSP